MTKIHQKRMGLGCRYEDFEDTNLLLCSYAETQFGIHTKCTAPKKCWLDQKITNRFDDNKHCPNCSKPNKPILLIKDNAINSHCSKCDFHLESVSMV